jgi:hypothetical protein
MEFSQEYHTIFFVLPFVIKHIESLTLYILLKQNYVGNQFSTKYVKCQSVSARISNSNATL